MRTLYKSDCSQYTGGTPEQKWPSVDQHCLLVPSCQPPKHLQQMSRGNSIVDAMTFLGQCLKQAKQTQGTFR